MDKTICHLVLQFDSMRFTKDGGGKITFEFGSERIKEIQKIQDWTSHGEMNLAVAIKPLEANNFSNSDIDDLEY